MLSLNFLKFVQVGFNVKQEERLRKKQLFPQNIDYVADMFLIYMPTLSIFC